MIWHHRKSLTSAVGVNDSGGFFIHPLAQLLHEHQLPDHLTVHLTLTNVAAIEWLYDLETNVHNKAVLRCTAYLVERVPGNTTLEIYLIDQPWVLSPGRNQDRTWLVALQA